MKLKSTMIAAAALAALLPAAAHADGLQGKTECQFSGAWFDLSGNGQSVKIAGVTGSYNRFVTPRLEVGAPLIFGNVNTSGTNVNIYAVQPEATYYFLGKQQASPYVPYVGAGLTWVHSSGDTIATHDSTKPTYYAGIKYFLGDTPSTSTKAIFVEYRHLDFDFGSGSGDVHADGAWAGMSFILK